MNERTNISHINTSCHDGGLLQDDFYNKIISVQNLFYVIMIYQHTFDRNIRE